MNGNGNGKAHVTWNLNIVSAGALGLIGTFLMVVGKDASIALDVARQHGEEILMIRGELVQVHNELNTKTIDRYTSKDAERDFGYIKRDLEECRKYVEEHKNFPH